MKDEQTKTYESFHVQKTDRGWAVMAGDRYADQMCAGECLALVATILAPHMRELEWLKTAKSHHAENVDLEMAYRLRREEDAAEIERRIADQERAIELAKEQAVKDYKKWRRSQQRKRGRTHAR